MTVAAALRRPEPAERDLGGLKEEVRARALDLGFDAAGFAAPDLPCATRGAYRAYIEAGRHGDMDWLARTPERRETPRGLWPEVRSVVVLAVNYGPDEDPRPLLERRDRANVSVYARNRDYHDL
ncbi:MAG TPA: QueG-associated DUF1730 domain-containing protein, partial [Geminicoccaceae bacterium]|nr:QueG-associated DUF1730 domain-containing protein [Geminicoccaceae bacterium]